MKKLLFAIVLTLSLAVGTSYAVFAEDSASSSIGAGGNLNEAQTTPEGQPSDDADAADSQDEQGDQDATGAAESDEEAESGELEVWPIIISGVAAIVMVLAIIILNLTHRS